MDERVWIYKFQIPKKRIDKIAIRAGRVRKGI